MEPLILIAAAVVLAYLLLPVVAIFKAAGARRLAEQLRLQVVSLLENEVRLLRRRVDPAEASPERERKPEPVPERKAAAPAPVSPVFVPEAVQPDKAALALDEASAAFQTAQEPPPLPKVSVPEEPVLLITGTTPTIKKAPARPLEWEQFMGAKLFAWIGGFALFLGIGFFVKYSFEHNLIPPEVRVAIGFVAGIGLLLGGLFMRRKENAVTAQTLCATGILVLYAVTFACRAYYHFPFFGPTVTFLLMALVTAVAFLLSVRMNALVVAVLGVSGGFLTPFLLSNGQDSPLALFGYIALLDIGLLAIARRQKWGVLHGLGVAGTLVTEGAWFAAFFEFGKYFLGNRVLIPMAILAGFQALFLGAAYWSNRKGRQEDAPAYPALALGASALLGVFYFVLFRPLGHRPILLCADLFLVDLGLVALTLMVERLAAWRVAPGVAVFAFLGIWTESYLTNGNLNTALGCYFVFALFHTALPLILQRIRKTAAPVWSQLFPVFSLLLVLMPILRLQDLSLFVWPFVLLIDVLAFLVAVMTLTLAPIILILILTLVAIGGTLLRIPSDLTGLPSDLFLLGAGALFFLAAGAWAARRLAPKAGLAPRLLGSFGDPTNLVVQLPALSAVLPFLLLIMVILRLPLRDPSPVFGLALLLVVLLLGLARILSLEALPVVGLVSVLALEHSWLASPFHAARPALSLGWYLVFYAVFTVFPFLFRQKFAQSKAPWAASALAGPAHFYLVYEVARMVFPNMQPGLAPALFAVPSLAGLALLAGNRSASGPALTTQLALYGGVALFFITLIFPLQFDRQWITISWALEGAALCWLFHRVPHPGLRLTGVVLLGVAFARLALNPLVLSYHARAAQPFFNWYLYAFGSVSLALYAGARLLAPPRHRAAGVNAPPLLYTMGTVLLFLLVNIEIADYFARPGAPALAFEFYGNFARDMSYSIAWALFALVLLIIGMKNRTAGVRYASLGLLSVTVLKLFLHDLSELDQLYRIGAFIAVAVIAMFASFLYQRFLALPAHDTDPATPP